MVISLCRQYKALPLSGGLLEQPAWFLRMHTLLARAGERAAVAPMAEDDPFDSIPMVTL